MASPAISAKGPFMNTIPPGLLPEGCSRANILITPFCL